MDFAMTIVPRERVPKVPSACRLGIANPIAA
jgi:hypothetical protein